MKHIERLKKLIESKKGIVYTSDLARQNIPRICLVMLICCRKLEKVCRGVYINTDDTTDEKCFFQSRYSKTTCSHEITSFLHGLADRTPFKYAVNHYFLNMQGNPRLEEL